MPTQKGPLPSSASPGPDAQVEEAPGADVDGCGFGDRRSPKLTLNGVEERDGGPRQAKDPAPRYYWAFDDARPADSGHLLAMRVRIARCCLCMGVAERVLV